MHIPSLKEVVSAEEWALRCDLAACYRLVAAYGWSDLVFTHISAKLPDSVTGGEHQFLINPYGLMFDEITASSLVKVDMACNKLIDSPFPVNPAGFVIHSAVHEARPEVQCVLHTHTRAGCAVAALACGLLPVNQISMEFYGRVAYHDYEGIALDLAEQKRLVADMGDKSVLMLRNHGLLTVGETVSQAFLRMYYLEKACEIQLAAQSAGQLILPSTEVCVRTERQFNAPGRGFKQGELTDPDALQLAWAALLRMLEKVAPGYQD